MMKNYNRGCKNRQCSCDFNSNYLRQQQLDRQKVEQKLDLEYIIDILGRALSKAEIYAFRFGNQYKLKNEKPIFGFYNRFNNGYEFEKQTLFKSLINAVKSVDYGLEETESKYKEILFPKNMKKEEVIEYIAFLGSCLYNNEDRSIYQKLIDVLERKKTDFSCYKQLYDRNARMNPKKMMEKYSDIYKAFGRKEYNWRNRIENDPNYFPGFVKNRNYEDDEDFKDVYRKEDDDVEMK